MSKNLIINTQDRIQSKWTATSEMAIREDAKEPSLYNKLIHDQEEQEEEQEEDEDEEEEEDIEEEGSDYTSSPSIPDENINFDLVYTLHSFEATVDGQATVKKGDALTLLDDSNSYWWLIRDLKTSEVGYIPAENIETPFERLARLNKHRNVELTSIEQAAHYINNVTQKPVNHKKKKVVLSASMNVQLHILITGDNEDEIESEAFEIWDEPMIINDQDDQDDQDDDDDNNETRNGQISDSKNKLDNNDDGESQQQNKEIPTTVNNHAHPVRHESRVTSVPPVDSKIIRVFAGNVDVGASYHSIRITESTSVNELLSDILEKFHISEIETKHGRSYGKNSGVEYYLTVETRDGDEIILDSEDKPYDIHESLTAHLTTPMPSLSKFKQFTSASDYTNNKKKKRASSISSLNDSSVQFCLHKRIKRVNDKSGQVHIKVSLMTATQKPTTNEKMNTIKKFTRFGKSKSNKKEHAKMERIDKLIATCTTITIAELTSIALVKFHIITDVNQPHQYRLILSFNGKDTLLNTEQKLSDVLKDQTQEKYFVLHNFSSKFDDKPLSKSSSTSSSSSSNKLASSKIFPENNLVHRNSTPVIPPDNQTDAILKRVDAILEAFEPNHRRDSNNLSVCRNKNSIDIQLPNGVLRSTTLADNTTQYSLLKYPNTCVLQLPDDYSPITRDELSSLFKYGSQYLDHSDNRSSMQLDRFMAEKEADKNLSSLADLEKELHRIITSHTS